MAIRADIVGIDSPEALERALRSAYYLADEGLAGASLTMPLKRAVMPLLHDADAQARLVGAANTVLFDDSGWRKPLWITEGGCK